MTGSDIKPYDRMFCYIWHEDIFPRETKHGEKWIPAGEDACKLVEHRVKESLGVKKHLWDEGRIKLDWYNDVSEYAKKVCPEKFKPHGRVDDELRKSIGHRIGRSEVHALHYEEVIIKVVNELKRVGQPLANVKLSSSQAFITADISQQIAKGQKTFLLELCARFGKTICSTAIAQENNANLVIVASYVLTSFASFIADIAKYEQFKNYVHVDTSLKDYEKKIKAAVKAGKPVLAYLSMCKGPNREKRIKLLFGIKRSRVIIIDEADQGIHKPGQADLLIKARKPDDVVIIMTGTNADRAVSLWNIDYAVSVTYPELLMDKKDTLAGKVFKTPKLNYFETDIGRNLLYPAVEFYQMNLGKLVDRVIKTDPDMFADDNDKLPSWSKFAANPLKAKGFYTQMMEAVFLGKHSLDELNIDLQTESVNDRRVAMVFFSGAIKNKNLALVKQITNLPNYEVITLSGDEKINGQKVKNKTVEKLVKEKIDSAQKEGKNVLILSSRIAQRSFSIPQITELYLAYDSGDAGTTAQKISRALTPDDAEKISKIVSLSFDPNRDDKFDDMFVETTKNYAKKKGLSFGEALKQIISTIDIFSCTDGGRVKLEVDEYTKGIIERNSIRKITARTLTDTMTEDEIKAYASGKSEMLKKAIADKAAMGKTWLKPKAKKGSGNGTVRMSKTDLKKAREVITTILSNVDIIQLGTKSKTIKEAIAKINKDKTFGYKEAIKEEFGFDFDPMVTNLLVDPDGLLQYQLDYSMKA